MVSAEVARQKLSIHGHVRPQSSSDWAGVFPIPVAVEQFYQEVGPVSVKIQARGNPYFLPSLAELWQFQAGYRWNGLTNEPIDNWPDDWLVVANQGGDPLIFVRSSGTVLHSYAGMGAWDTSKIFPDLNTMAYCLAEIGAIALEAGDEFLDEDFSIRPEYLELAIARFEVRLGSRSTAEAVLGVLEWY